MILKCLTIDIFNILSLEYRISLKMLLNKKTGKNIKNIIMGAILIMSKFILQPKFCFVKFPNFLNISK